MDEIITLISEEVDYEVDISVYRTHHLSTDRQILQKLLRILDL